MPATPPRSDRRWLALPVVFAASFMAILDIFIVNVANPAIQRDLGASAGAVQWIVAGYVLAYAVTLVTGGRIGDAIGRRRAFRIGIGVFTAASALCGAAPGEGTLIAARVVQGLGAALMMPQVMSIIQVEFSAEERPRCFAIMGGVIGVASVAGQLVGGGLIALFDWRAVFLINVPVGAATLIAAGRLIPESRAPRGRGLDLPGVALGTLALLLVITPAVQGRESGWPWWVPASVAAAVPVAWLWLAHERRLGAAGGSPLVDLGLFALPTFRRGIAIVLAFWTAVPVFFLALAQFLQNGHGLSAIDSGLVYTPMAVAFVTASLVAPRLGARTVPLGAGVTVVGSVLVALVTAVAGADLALAPLMAALVVMGTGQGLIMPGALGAVLQSVPATSAGSASGVLTTTQQTGNALGVAIGGALFFGIAGTTGGAGDFGAALTVCAGWTAVGAAITTTLALPRRQAAPALRPEGVVASRR